MVSLAIIGSGQVGGALALRFAEHDHQVCLAGRGAPSERAQAVLDQNNRITYATVADAVAAAEVVFLATPYAAAVEAVQALDMTGKVLVDCTNPVGPGLTHGLQSKHSGAEAIAAAAQGAAVVKAFTVYGVENISNSSYPNYGSLLPAMPIAGDDAEAKQVVAGLCSDLGFEPIDCGPLAMSLHLEHQTLLWVHMARLQGQGVDLVWGRLRR